MSRFINVFVIVEGKTEEIFINKLLATYLAERSIYMTASQISKPGQKGGDVKFSRALADISTYMKQRPDTYISLLIDYYGIKNDWPGLLKVKEATDPRQIASIINDATHKAVNYELSELNSGIRFIPNIIVHEFESLLFSDAEKLASVLEVNQSKTKKIVASFGEPEKINNSSRTAPSKRLEALFPGYKKTLTGINIAEKIGIKTMRDKCKVFDGWISKLEQVVG